MGFFLGRGRERRDDGGAPVFGLSGPRIALSRSNYADVDGSNPDTALQSVAVGASMDLIASLASELPISAYRGQGSSRVPISLPGYLEDPGGDGYGRQDWAYRAMMSWLGRGNLYGEVLDRRPTHLTQVEIFHPDKVSGTLEDGAPVWTVGGKRYDDPNKFVHRRVNPMPGQILGRSVIAYHASTIGVSLASTQFGQQWFRDGAHPTGLLKNTEVDLDPTPGGNADTAKKRFLAALRGTREPLVLGRGWEYTPVQVVPEESQFLETMGYSEAQCARIFGPGIAEVLGYTVKGGSLTYGNIQDRGLHLLTYALNKWFLRLERLYSSFLPRPQYVVLERDAILQTNTMQRFLSHASALDKRWKTVNEVRAAEMLDPVPWGDEPNSGGVGPPLAPVPEDEDQSSDEDDADRARAVAELIQKVYLGVGVVVTDEEARELANRAGAGLTPGPLPVDAPPEDEDTPSDVDAEEEGTP